MKNTLSSLVVRWIVVAVLVVCCSGGSLQARTFLKNPIKDYLTSTDLDTRASVEQSAELLKLSVDVNGNGKPWMMLSLPLHYERGGGFIWTVYVPFKGGYRKAAFPEGATNFACYADRIFVGAISELGGQRGIVTFYISHGTGELHAYWLKHNHLADTVTATFEVRDEAGNPDGTITHVPILLKYFLGVAKHDSKSAYTIEHISFDSLRAHGYDIPAEQ